VTAQPYETLRVEVAGRIGRLTLDRIPVMGGHLSIEAEGDSLDISEIPSGLTLVHAPRQATS